MSRQEAAAVVRELTSLVGPPRACRAFAEVLP